MKIHTSYSVRIQGYSAVLDRNLELGQKLGINSIPAVIFPDGYRYTGLMSVEAIEENLANSAAKK